MTSITRDLRKDLEKTVKQARRVAEAGARQAVQQLRVGDGDAPKDLTPDQRALRTQLRAHGRQLGDRRDTKTGTQETDRLIQECAYEHWHRMLFARFLAETDLLIEPESGVAITLDEVQELAREKATDWLELASEYAERMLPQIFRKDDPVLQIALPPETRSEMEDLLKGLSKPVFEADDSLGWVYQFWQADKKDEVNKSETKIGADELPAVTQLFTEDYMVLFLLHNSLGAWWAGRVLAANPSLATSDADEAALRAACKVGDIDWCYLSFVREKGCDGVEGPWRPAAGEFDGWPRVAKDLTVLDPCMGSGHFLVFALPILIAFRMAEEGLSQSAAIDAVLRDNLFGLEIDPRCTQIAAFNLAFAAWRKIGHRRLPRLNLACSGLAIGVTKAEWLKLAEKSVMAADPAAKRDLLGFENNLLTVGLGDRVKNGLDTLYDLFAKAPWLGSLIEPRRAGADIFREGFDKIEALLSLSLSAADTDETREIAVAAQGMVKAAELLTGQFTLVITNVPYLGRGKQDNTLADYCEQIYPEAKADLATCFIRRCLSFCDTGSSTILVTPQNWLFQHHYKNFRIQLLKNEQWNFVVRLGPGAFETISGEVVKAALVGITRNKPDLTRVLNGWDVTESKTPTEKAKALCAEGVRLLQKDQLESPDSRVVFESAVSTGFLGDFASALSGMSAGDSLRFDRLFWEVSENGKTWEFVQSTVNQSEPYGGRSDIILWEQERGAIYELAQSVKHLNHAAQNWLRGKPNWGKKGVVVSQTGDLPVTLYHGDRYDLNCCAIVPNDISHLSALWTYCSSDEFRIAVRNIDQALKVTPQSLLKIPFDLAHWEKIAQERYPNGLPKPVSGDPTQWLFNGNPADSTLPLQVAVMQLLGYRWPRQTGSSFPDCPALAQDALESLGDDDGIVCLTAVKGEPPAEQRLNAILAEAFGADWSAAKLASLLTEAGYSGKSLDDWLRDGFFSQHCEQFNQRPFIWQIWDGRRDGFHALVNYHQLAAPNGEGRRTLEKLIYSYLGDWIDRQRTEQKADVEGADARLAHSEHLKTELIKILEGEPPYDIFVRWKPLHGQPLGWDPDINDGVRINIRPFMSARPLNARGANACVLRAAPKIKWDKDRGKEQPRETTDYPWFWGWDEATADFAGDTTFDGNRWNSLHYSRAMKQAARDRHQASVGGKI